MFIMLAVGVLLVVGALSLPREAGVLLLLGLVILGLSLFRFFLLTSADSRSRRQNASTKRRLRRRRE